MMLKFLAYDWVWILGVFGRFCVRAVMVYLGVSLGSFLLFLFFRLLSGFSLALHGLFEACCFVSWFARLVFGWINLT